MKNENREDVIFVLHDGADEEEIQHDVRLGRLQKKACKDNRIRVKRKRPLCASVALNVRLRPVRRFSVFL